MNANPDGWIDGHMDFKARWGNLTKKSEEIRNDRISKVRVIRRIKCVLSEGSWSWNYIFLFLLMGLIIQSAIPDEIAFNFMLRFIHRCFDAFMMFELKTEHNRPERLLTPVLNPGEVFPV